MRTVSTEVPPDIELATPFREREIACAFHDIDGTHSLIREWIPVMALVTGVTAENGFISDPAEFRRHSPGEFPFALEFAVESAGLSALTQMEWGLRRAAAAGKIRLPFDPGANERIIGAIEQGRELFDSIPEPPEFKAFLLDRSSKLFRIYERLLLEMSRDRNLEAARRNPAAWRVPGSLEFLEYLNCNGVRNFFVTGAVVEYDSNGRAFGTMCEEVEALGFEIGSGRAVEALHGSGWEKKMPKHEIMTRLCRSLAVPPEQILVVGDGRSEIEAGVSLGCLTLSRLPADARRPREIHRALGTHLITDAYRPGSFRKVFRER